MSNLIIQGVYDFNHSNVIGRNEPYASKRHHEVLHAQRRLVRRVHGYFRE